MTKRIKKPPVTPEQTLDWLNRNDLGESAPQIAKKDDYDVRTVRSHLQRVKQERERNEARATVLRKALEDHYKDLCNFAFKLDPTNPNTVVIPSLPADDNIMVAALRQHLPRSPIWNLSIKKDRLESESEELLNKTRKELERIIPEEPKLRQLESELSGVSQGINQFFVSQVELRSQQDINMKISEYLRLDSEAEGFYIQLGYSRLGYLKERENAESYLEILRPVIDELEQIMKDLQIFQDLTDRSIELERTKQKLHEEISIIRLRRLVPGRCKFCPL